ncbi:MAG: hypothetical protein EP329_20750 [Deltaproteobacteria bacterium]|nr:MAG: hypothetical protein EP329_20750 [Deltaproteobacteria bacterium]
MDLSPSALWASMGLLAKIVTIILLVMAFACLVVFVERLWAYFRTYRKSKAFAMASSPALERNRFNELPELCRTHEGSLLAELVEAGFAVFARARRLPGQVTAVELTRRELDRKLETQASRLRRGLPVLASTGSVAPFVGLFGTVVGIITAFEGIAREGGGGLGAVSKGIAEALAVTAVGLAVAIPSVLAFNFLQTLSERIELQLSTAASELTDVLENAPEDVIDDALASLPSGASADAAVVAAVEAPASAGGDG